MRTSQTILVSKPDADDVIPPSALTYMRTRLKHRVLSLILREFKKAKISQAELARRLGMDRTQLSRTLSGPGNMTLETISDLLFAIDGLEMTTAAHDPLQERVKPRQARRILNEAAPVSGVTQIATSNPVWLDRYRKERKSQAVNIIEEAQPDQAA